MSVVINLTSPVDRDLIKKLFYRFTQNYGAAWTSRHKSESEWEDGANYWTESFLEFDRRVFTLAVKQALELYKDFPPTLPQLMELCRNHAGIPTPSEVMDLMIRKDFSHPLVKLCYDKMGSWTLSHAKKEEVLEKVTRFYSEAITSFNQDQKSAWIQLEDFKATQAIKVIELPKIPSNHERKSFRENLKCWTEKAAVEKAALPTIEHPVWDKAKINPSHDNFCSKTHNERKRYLVSVEEHLSTTLSHEDWYDRTRYFKETEANTMISRNRAANPAEPEKSSPRPSSYVKPAYRSWVN
jgi:hypothetical protein